MIGEVADDVLTVEPDLVPHLAGIDRVVRVLAR